ncbi:MAG: CPBP family intramembrane metalloprotease [Bacilli bacterium]|nr:CPBP family intramembrane metalloprotease [Bacilli bacterium]
MEKEKKEEKKNIFRFFLKMFFIFLILDLFMMFIATMLTNTTSFFKYGSDLITEMFYALAVLVVMLLFKNSYVFTDKRTKFWDGVKLAIPILAISIINLVDSASSLSDFSLAKFINVLVFCVFIGIAEEFLCRGWLQNEFIERYSDNKKNVITSIILASLVFGLMHITNLGAQTTFETILQIINATAIGVLFGSIYYKTKNIWTVIFLHSFYDFSIFLGEMNMIKDCTYNEPTFGVTLVSSIGMVLVSLLWILNAILVIKKTNFPDKRASKNKSINTVKLLIVIVFIIALLPFENFFKEEYEDYEVCYNYTKIDMPKNYTIHSPNFKSYNIEKIVETEETYMNIFNYRYLVYLENGKVKMKNINTNYEVTFSFKDITDIEVIESENRFMLVFLSSENESTIYYSDYIERMNMSDENSYLDSMEEKFKKYELPEVSRIGYITIDHNDLIKYPFISSLYYDYFMIKDGELYLLDE